MQYWHHCNERYKLASSAGAVTAPASHAPSEGCCGWQVRLIQAPKAINRHDPTPRGPSLSDRLSAWLQENNVRTAIGGDLQLLKWLARCLLTIGGRSIGHLYSYLDRHEPIMNELVTTTGDQVSSKVWCICCHGTCGLS